jgi:hypothetical protein
LLRFGAGTLRLQIQNLDNAVAGENMMTSSHAFLKPQIAKQTAQLVESNVGVGFPAQDT